MLNEERLIPVYAKDINPVGYSDQIVLINFNGSSGTYPAYQSTYSYKSSIFYLKYNSDVGGKNYFYCWKCDVKNIFDHKTCHYIYIDKAPNSGYGRFIISKSGKIPGSDIYKTITYLDSEKFSIYNSESLNNVLSSVIYIPLNDIKNCIPGDSKNFDSELSSASNAFRDNLLSNEFIINEIFKTINKISKIPLLKEWVGYCLNHPSNPIGVSLGKAYYSDLSNPENIYAFSISFTDSSLKKVISDGLKNKDISIKGTNTVSYQTNNISNLTDYLSTYSDQLIEKASNKFTPLFDAEKDKFTEKEQNYFDFTEYYGKLKFYNAQKNVICSVSKSLDHNRSAFIVGEMGCGKTALSIGATYVNCKKKNPNNIVMCPGHLVEKWKREIERLYPDAKAYIISDFNDLINVENRLNDKNRNYPLFLVISKDTAKINYTERPSVIYDHRRDVFRCPHCGSTFHPSRRSAVPGDPLKMQSAPGVNTDYHLNLHIINKATAWRFFLNKTVWNSQCNCYTHNRYTRNAYKVKNSFGYSAKSCGHSLWTATNIKEESPWIKFTGIGYLHKDMIKDVETLYLSQKANGASIEKTLEKTYKAILRVKAEGYDKQSAPRRYSIAKYLREHYKNQFDYFIADEVHMYSSSSSAQANAFGDLIKTAKKCITLTGTLLNGYADGIYYILYRMYPRSFQKRNFTYSNYIPFVEKYGVKSEITTYTNILRRMSGAKRTSKVLPGVSPKLFIDFLLDKAVFISLSDMSNALPNYTEVPVPVDLDALSVNNYNAVKESLGQIMSAPSVPESSINKRQIAFQAAQKLNIYPDQPYDVSPVYDLNTGKTIFTFPDSLTKEELKEYVSNKDIKTIELIQKHIQKGENVLVYVNFVNKTDCVERLEKALKHVDIKYCVLDTKVSSKNREEWIDKKVKEGVRVMICNPTLVETGLDLLAFTTIIFYQVGYNLFTMRQASRRSLRLNQPNNVTVYFMYYASTAQETILSLMANKLQASMAIEGKFTEEGLNAMSNNDDILTQIADSLVKNIEHKIEEGAFSSGLGRPEDDDGSRFQLVHILSEKTKEKQYYSLFNETKKAAKKFDFNEPRELICVAS